MVSINVTVVGTPLYVITYRDRRFVSVDDVLHKIYRDRTANEVPAVQKYLDLLHGQLTTGLRDKNERK